jgi:hypothetical protein
VKSQKSTRPKEANISVRSTHKKKRLRKQNESRKSNSNGTMMSSNLRGGGGRTSGRGGRGTGGRTFGRGRGRYSGRTPSTTAMKTKEREIKFSPMQYQGTKVQVTTYATTKEVLIQYIQKTYRGGMDVARSLEDMQKVDLSKEEPVRA